MTTLNGHALTVHFLLNDPVLVHKTLAALTRQYLTAHEVLKSRVDATGSGSAIFNAEPAFADENDEVVGQLAEYPLTEFSEGTPSLVLTDKWGLATDIARELIARNRMDVMKSRMLRLAATIATNFDKRAYSAIGSSVVATHPTAGTWGTSSADPLLDVLTAGAKLEELGKGYKADTIVATPTKWAQLVAATKVLDASPREAATSTVLTGGAVKFAGLNIIKTNNFPAGTSVLVADSRFLGSVVTEELGGDYQGSAADAASVQTKIIPLDRQDGVRLQVRKVAVPWVNEPEAGIKLTDPEEEGQ